MDANDNNAPDGNGGADRQSQKAASRGSSRNRKRDRSQRSNKSRASSNQRSQGSNMLTDSILPPLSRAGIPQQRNHIDTGVDYQEPANALDDFGTNGNENYMFDTGT